MKLLQGVGVKGIVHLVARDAEGNFLGERHFENLVPSAGLAFAIGGWTGDTDMSTMKYIGVGTVNTAADPTDTALGAEVETRATGVQSRVTTTVANDTLQVVGTVTMTAPRALVECGLLSASTNGTLGARQVFTVMNLASGNTLTITWQWVLANA